MSGGHLQDQLYNALSAPLTSSFTAAEMNLMTFGFRADSSYSRSKVRQVKKAHLFSFFVQFWQIQSFVCPGAELWLQSVWKAVQALVHPVNSPPHPLGHEALPLPVLWEKVSPEVRHEETHLHTHR